MFGGFSGDCGESKGDTRYYVRVLQYRSETQHQDAPFTKYDRCTRYNRPQSDDEPCTIVDDGSRLPNDPKDVSPINGQPDYS